MEGIYGLKTLRPEIVWQVVISPPPTRWQAFVWAVCREWAFFKDMFWPCFLIALAVAVLRHV